jgi:hypothetical protein
MSDTYYYKKYLKYKSKYLNLKQIGGAKLCTPEELMTLPNYGTECKNVTKVVGSCGEPSFKEGKKSKINDIEKEKLLHIFNLFYGKVEEIHIILGANPNFKSDFRIVKDNYVCLFFDPNGRDDIYSDTTEKINFPQIKEFKFKLPFPLNFTDTNSKEILDKIIEIHNKGINVYITNRICGTCFPSFYYLVKNGIQYKVAPEQGLDDILKNSINPQDTEEIKDCFNPLIYKYNMRKYQLDTINIIKETINVEK